MEQKSHYKIKVEKIKEGEIMAGDYKYINDHPNKLYPLIEYIEEEKYSYTLLINNREISFSQSEVE